MFDIKKTCDEHVFLITNLKLKVKWEALVRHRFCNAS